MTAAQEGCGGAAVDADVALWAAAVVVNGGTVSAGRLTIVNTFVTAEKASGAWALTDDYWVHWAENAPQALTSLKQRRLGVATNSPTFTTDRDYTFDGLSSYINTGFVPSTHAIAWTLGNMRWAAYERTNLGPSGANSVLGTSSANSGGSIFRPRTNTNTMIAQLSSSSATFTSITDSRSLTAVSRAGNGTTGKAYKIGSALTDATGLTTLGTVLSTSALTLGASNVSGTPASFRASALGFACVGAPLSAGQETAQYNAVQAWATSVGANV